MAAILQPTHSNEFSLMIILIRISLKFVLKGQTDNKPALVQVLAWRWTNAYPVPWWIDAAPGGRLNKKDGLTRYGDSHVKDKTS